LTTTAAGNVLNWSDGGNNGATTLIQYNIGRSTTRGGPYANIGNTTGLTYIDNTGAAGTDYFYAINDQNTGGTSAWSEEVIRFYPFTAATADLPTYKTENLVRARWPIYQNEIVKTFVGLSTVQGEANLTGFIDVGHATEYSFAGLSLQTGTTYYVTVKVQGTQGYLDGYGTSICSSNGFVYDFNRDLVDVANVTYFNGATARVMTSIAANSVSSSPFGNNVIRRYRAPITVKERGIESRFNAPVEFNVGGAGFPTSLAAAQQQLRIANEWGEEVPVNVTAYGPVPVAESFLYNSGTEFVSFVPGYSNGVTGDLTEGALSTVIRAFTNNNTERVWVTDSTVDLTGWDQLQITWSNTGANDTDNLSRIIVSTNKNGDYNDAPIAASLNKTSTFSEISETVDISALNGNYYIRVHARRNGNNGNSTVNVFNISLRRVEDKATAVLIANVPFRGERNYWAFWGGGTAAYPNFIANSNDTSQRAWSRYYSRKLLPPGVEIDPISAWTKLIPTEGFGDIYYDRGGRWVTLPWSFPYFDIRRQDWFLTIKGTLHGTNYHDYSNTMGEFTGNAANRLTIASIWLDTSIRDADPQPQNIGFYTQHKDGGNANERQGFYWRANRYGMVDDIYIHQAFLYMYGDIALRYEYLTYNGLWRDDFYDNPVNPVDHTVGISRNNGNDYFYTTPLIEGIGKTPTSFFQYKNAVEATVGPISDAQTLAGAGWGYAGHFDSHVFDSRITNPEWQQIFYEVTANSGRMNFWVRTGSTSEPDSNWSAWTLVASNVAANGNQLLSLDQNRFIQYRCEFLKNAVGDNPVLNRVEFRCRGFEITQVAASTPEGVTQGQESIPVTVTVKNYDPANDVDVDSIDLLFSLGSFTYALDSPVALPFTIPAGGQQDFVFLVNVKDDSPIGTSTVDAVATASIGAQDFCDNGADLTHDWEVKSKAELFIQQIDTTPLTVNKGQSVRVRMMLNNPGGTAYYFDAATLTFSLGTYTQTLDSPALPVLIEPGESIIATFTVFVKPESPSGVAILDGTAIGRNKLSNKIASDTSALLTDSWTIQNPASLVIQTVVASDTVYRGQTGIPVYLTVINMGEALARWDLSEILLSFGTYDAILPQNAFPIDVFGGLSEAAEYWVSVAEDSATGTSDVDARIEYRDGNTNDFYNPSGALFPTSWTIIGEKVKTYKDSALLFESTSFNRPVLGTVDIFARASDLAPLKEYVVRWYKPDGTEFANTAPPKTSDASGTVSHQIEIDSAADYGLWTVKITNPLNTHTACQNTFQVVSPADPEIIFTLPARVSVGQTFNASATIVNSGGAIFKTSYVGNLVKGGAGNANILSGPLPAIQDVPGNGAATFSYQWQAVTQGNFTVQGAGYGYDANSDDFLIAATQTSNVCLIQTPPSLEVFSVTEAYTNVYCNQQNLTVTMRIRNNGEADAMVEAASLTFSLGDHSQVINPPASFPLLLAGGAFYDLVFTVGIAADSPTGAVTVGGSFRAFDVNNPSAIYSATGGAGAWTISAIAGICSANSTYNPEQYAFNVGQTVYARFVNLPLNTEYRIRFYNDSPTGGTRVKTSAPLNSGAFGVCDDLWWLDPGLASTLTQRWRVSIDTGNYATEGTIVGYQYFDVQNPGNMVASLTISPTELFVGETFSVTLIASNTVISGSTVASATPASLVKTLASTGEAVVLSGPDPGIASIAPLLPGVFQWTFEATQDTTLVGSFSVSADLASSLAGYDCNTGAAISSNKALSNSIFIYRRALGIGSSTLDFLSLLPGEQSSVLKFNVLNEGNYNLNNIKWTTADMKNQFGDYISKSSLQFNPQDFAILPGNSLVADAQLLVPYNQASGSYIATMSVYEDLNGNDNRDFIEPVKLFSVKVEVPRSKRIIVADQFIDLDNWSQGQTTNIKAVNFFNGGNLDLDNLKVEQITGSAAFIFPVPTAPGVLTIAAASQLDVSAIIPGGADSGIYIATFTIYDDEADDGITPTDAHAEFAVKIGVGNKSFTITPATVNAGTATPTFVVENLPFQINNTGLLGLTALKPLAGTLVSGANSIASDNMALFLPLAVAPGATENAKLNLYIPAGQMNGLYTGKVWVYEDNNGNSVYDNGEASASFTLTADVPVYPAVQVIPSTVDLGDVAPGTGISTTFLCRNVGNVTLNKLHWEKIALLDGANNIPVTAYSFPGGEPFSGITAGTIFTREISINVPALQSHGNYVGNMAWLFEDNILVDGVRKVTDPTEPQSGFRVACRVGDLSLDLVEAGLSVSGDPSMLSGSVNFSIKNTGSLTIARPKATATVLLGPASIPATASIFLPSSIGYIVSNQTKTASWKVQIPANSPDGVYTGNISVWNDSNNNNQIDPGEAIDTGTLQLTVNLKRVIEVLPKPVLMGVTTENSSKSANFNIWNRGNMPLADLEGLAADLSTLAGDIIPGSSVFFDIPAAALAEGAFAVATVTVVVGPQIPGNYSGIMRIYDDYLPPLLSWTTEESDPFELRLTIGKKSFTVSSPVSFADSAPGATVVSLPGPQIVNTAAIPLSKLKWAAGDLISGANVIASTSIGFLPAAPVSVGVGASVNFTGNLILNPYQPSTHIPPGLYTGTNILWEDDNGDGVLDAATEASGTFLTRINILPVSTLDIETDPIDLGDVLQDQGSAMVSVTVRNTGNVDLNTFIWTFTNLVQGAETIDGISLLKSSAFPASLSPGNTTNVNVWLDAIPADQALGYYESAAGNLANLAASGLANDNVLISCNVIAGGPPAPKTATASLFQEITADIFVPPVAPQTDLFFLSTWVCPGSGSADIAFVQYDSGGLEVATISMTVNPDGTYSIFEPHASFKTESSGVLEKIPFAYGVENLNYYRVYFSFRLIMDVPDIGADTTRIILHNSGSLPGQGVWFDGVKLERAYEGQVRPGSYHPISALRSPTNKDSIDGDRSYSEW
jgi:hypothetical protein